MYNSKIQKLVIYETTPSNEIISTIREILQIPPELKIEFEDEDKYPIVVSSFLPNNIKIIVKTKNSNNDNQNKSLDGNSVQNMKIFVNSLAGHTNIEINAKPSDTIEQIKKKIQDSCGIPPDQQRLVAHGQQLKEGNKTINDYGIENLDTIHMILKLRGGRKRYNI